MTPKTRDQQLNLATLRLSEAIFEAVGHRGVPSGHVYAAVMSVVTLDQYAAIVASMKDVNAVKESKLNYLTRGPKYEEALKNLRFSIAEMEKVCR